MVSQDDVSMQEIQNFEVTTMTNYQSLSEEEK
jgi:hypothetical protein